MQIKTQENGLYEHELKALEKIQQVFSEPDSLRQNSPWQGYAGFRFVDAVGKDGEYDLILLTNANIIVVELKDWNGYSVTSNGGRWYMDDHDMGGSPVATTRKKQQTLMNKVKTLRSKLTANAGHLPRIEFFVVMCGKADFKGLPHDEAQHVISLDDFLKLGKKEAFTKFFRPHPKAQHLYLDFHVLDELFTPKNIAPRSVIVHNYKQEDEIFSHPKHVYREYSASEIHSQADKGIIRKWDFSCFSGMLMHTNKNRFELLSHERKIASEFVQSQSLRNIALTPLVTPTEQDLTQQYNEVIKLPPTYVRFNTFISSICLNFSENDRLDLIQIILGKFAEVHKLNITHGNISAHSVWISPQKDIAISNLMTASMGKESDDFTKIQFETSINTTFTNSSSGITAFQCDTYWLAYLIWHLWHRERIDVRKGLANNTLKVDETHWLGALLKKAFNFELDNAIDLFNEFISLRPKHDVQFKVDPDVLNEYLTQDNLFRKYPEDDLLYELDKKSLYVSDGFLVKQWLNIVPTSLSSSNLLKYKKFFEQLKSIQTRNFPYLPNIISYGLAQRMSALYLITKKSVGLTIDQIELDTQQKIEVISQLLQAMIELDENGLALGNIKKSNVLFNSENLSIIFNDIIDIEPDIDYQSDYYPSDIESPTTQQCHNYTAICLVCDILDIKIGDDYQELKWISDAIKLELHEPELRYTDLTRLLEAIKVGNKSNVTYSTIDITVPNLTEEIKILPDNGRIYVMLEKSRTGNDIFVQFFGLGGSVQFVYDPKNKRVNSVFKPRIRDRIPSHVIEQAVLELNIALSIKPAERNPNYFDLNELIKNKPEFLGVILDFYQDLLEEQKQADTNESVELEIVNMSSNEMDSEIVEISSSETVESEQDRSKSDIRTNDLWKAILETETEALPYVTLTSELEVVGKNICTAYYDDEANILDNFRKDDKITAIFKTKDKFGRDAEYRVGDIDITHSVNGELRLIRVKKPALYGNDDVLYLRTKADKASYIKRKSALEKILQDKVCIPNLVEYFEPNTKIEPIKYDIDVTDEDFEHYDQYKGDELVVSLNPLQRAAFRKLLKYGPVSILQGPPGTGKTEFIAAFVHYLFEKQNTNNILMVSQSHEAVNTAAERVRKHAIRLKTPIDIVRFSNRESSVSMDLKDVYSGSIISTHRQLFLSNIRNRVLSLSQAVGIDKSYLELVLYLRVQVFGHLSQTLEEVESGLDDAMSQQEWDALSIKILERVSKFSSEISKKFSNLVGRQILENEGAVWKFVDLLHGVNGQESARARALANIAYDYEQLIDSPNANYETFLAKTKQFVCGTCVGIGHRSIGIADQAFDWVIIDESARSISSELAIAMQSAKRILLVGDHKQLPPLYSPEHSKALGLKLGISKDRLDENLISDFERLFTSSYGDKVNGKLLVQYRMAPAIGQLVSDCFYEGELLTGVIEPYDEEYDEKLVRVVPNIYQSEIAHELNTTVTWVDTSDAYSEDKGGSFYNKHEARKIIGLLERIQSDHKLVGNLKALAKPNEPPIGIICMYAEQKRYLRSQFNSKSWDDDFRHLVKIDTVDSYQGKENRIIFLSVTRHSQDNKIGFMKLPNRINVALSRAMDRLVIFGAANLWTHIQHQKRPLGLVLKYIQDHQMDYCFIPDQNIHTSQKSKANRPASYFNKYKRDN